MTGGTGAGGSRPNTTRPNTTVEWELAIVAVPGGLPDADSPLWGLGGAVFIHGTTIEQSATTLPELIGNVTAVAPRMKPERIVLVHPRTMGVDEVGLWLSALTDMGVRSGKVETISDTEVLARAIYGSPETRDIVVIDATTGDAYTRRGATGDVASVPRMVADAGALTTSTVAVGMRSSMEGIHRELNGTQVRVKQCNVTRLAALVFDPEFPVDEAMPTSPAQQTLARQAAKKGEADRNSPEARHRKAIMRMGLISATVTIMVIVSLVISLRSGETGATDQVERVDQVEQVEFADDEGQQVLEEADRIGGNPADVADGSMGYAWWDEPTVGETPPSPPAGATVPQAVSHYFRPFDPEPLLNSMGRCFPSDSDRPENLAMHCTGRKADIDGFAAANGLPELGSEVFSGVSVHFNYMGMNSPGSYDRGECFITYDRLQLTDARYLVTVSEPCTPDKERYEGPWPADEEVDIEIRDRTRGIVTGDGTELFPQLRIYGLKDNAAVDALMEFYGIAP